MQKTITPTTYRDALRQKVLQTAMKAFQQKGIKAVKMDDIASQLSISKRTLYELFENKEVLLRECLVANFEAIDRRLGLLSAEGANVMELIMGFYHIQVENLSHTNPLFYAELHKYPSILSLLQERHEVQQSHAVDFLNQGIREGYFRSGVNFDIIGRIGHSSLQYVMETRMYEKYPLDEIFYNTICLFIRGFCTEKGIRYLDKYM